MIGQTLNSRYKIISSIGRGAMGTVYLATDHNTGQPVAIKILASQLSTESAMVERFRREAETLRQLDHPNIVKFMDAFEHEAQFVIVMEFVSNGSLHDLIKTGPLPIDRARQIALDICDALIRAHRLNIIHRDIKPENVLLTKEGAPKLADFGVARLEEGTRMTRSGTQVGTPYYMAPEAWQGEALDAQADIWSLGAVLFEMLSGQVPFSGDSAPAVMTKVHTASPPDVRKLRTDASPNLAKIVSRMLTRDKKRRYQTMREVAVDLERSLESDTHLAKKTIRDTAEKVVSEKKAREKITLRDQIQSIRTLINSNITRIYTNFFPGWIEESSKEQGANDKLSVGSDYELILPLESTYDDIRSGTFLGREKEINQFVQQIYSARGGAFCLAGFRGVGKTRFLERSIELLRSRIEESDQRILVNIWLSLPQSYSPKELMHIIISSLINRLKELGIIHKLGRELEAQLSLISKRLSKTIRSSNSKNVELGINLGSLIQAPFLSIGRQGEEEFLSYEAPLAERDIISILRSLSNLSITHKFKTYKFRVVFVFDEMDKISDFDSLVSMLRSLKTLFNESATSFIFVLGADQFEMMSADENEGLASRMDLYIPCLWGKTENVLKPIIKNGITPSQTETTLLYQHFLNYLSFTGRGVPRRLWKTVDKYIFEENNSIFLGFSNKNVRRIRFYSELQNWLSLKMDSYLLQKPDLSGLQLDMFRMSVYAMADSILKSQGGWFTKNDVVIAFNSSSKILRLEDDFIGIFLNDLTQNEYLEKKEDKYRLSYRRYVEIGEMKDDTRLTGDFQVKGSRTEKDLANYTGNQFRTRLRESGDSQVGSVNLNDWALILEAHGDMLIVRTNEQYQGKKLHLIKLDAIKDKCDIGRASGNDIELGDEQSSRYHARLIYLPIGWQIIDMNTANKTLVDGTPIFQPNILADNSRITIGKTNILFRKINQYH